MRGYRLDLKRLVREYEHPSEDPYLTVGRMLRDHLGGNPLAEFRVRMRRDPKLQEQLATLVDELARTGAATVVDGE